ncbi:MAG TPA: hypothetical protein VF175_09295 [Lacipirellula sp.]
MNYLLRRRPVAAAPASRRFLILAALACVCGCSRGNPYDLVEVSGAVTYEDGSLIPAETIMLKFQPLAAPRDAKTHPRKAYGRVNVADGTIGPMTTHKYGDGVVAGRHKVLIIPTTSNGEITQLVPDAYRNPATTPVEIDTSEQPLEIRVKKP